MLITIYDKVHVFSWNYYNNIMRIHIYIHMYFNI